LNIDRDGYWRAGGERLLALDGPLWPRKEHTSVTDNPIPPDAPSPGARPGPDPIAPGTRAPGIAPSTAASGTAAAGTAADAAPGVVSANRITIDDFMKVELRVAKVLTAERVPKSKKLLKLSVDVGSETRTIVAGIADAYEPEPLVGRTVVIVFNLQPATLMGVESNGMVLAASPEDGKPMLLSFETPPPPGSRVR
jgi:methionyl-tRNA synthetase